METSFVTVVSVAGRVVHDLVAGVVETEPAALEDLPDGVHHHRTQVRRLRGALAAMRDILDAGQSAALEVALREWGAQLGAVRDGEVRAAFATAALEESGFDDERVRARLIDPERAGYDRLHARLVELSRLPRAMHRDAALREFGRHPALIEPDADAADVFEKLLRQAARRVRRAARHLDGSMERYHDLRKAGRRLRHLAEALTAAAPQLFGEAVEQLADAGKRLHDVLGDHRDEVLFAQLVDRARTHAVRAGEEPAPYDVMAAAARERARERIEQLPAAVRRVRRADQALPTARELRESLD
ncbi:CHAD domain-containing protein [Microbacterium sp. X-17]|uniref:CHAD domain-containing protein n=1 Tax=Microbacterium sp. X-17 TaxID=3144404 RepID=UPI0031F49A6A